MIMNNNIDEIEKGSYNIKFVSKEVEGLLEQFKNEMAKMETLRDSIISNNNAMRNAWQGSASEFDLSEIAQYGNTFEDVGEQNQKFVDSLYKTIDSYKSEEDMNMSKVNDNVNSFDFTRQEKA